MEQQLPINVDKLLQDLQSTEAYIRKTAAEEMGKLNSPNELVLSALKTVAESDDNKYVRIAAMESYLSLGGKDIQQPQQTESGVTKDSAVNETSTSDLKANHDEMLKQIRSWGLWSLGLGALHIVASGFLDSSWGILLIVVGLASFYYRTAPMFIIYTVTLAWAALSNLSSLNPEWMLAALFQFFLAFRTFKDFQRFSNTENELAQLSSDFLIPNKRATKSFPWIGILLSCSSIIGVVAYCVLTLILVEEFGVDSQPPAYYIFLIRLVEVIGVLGFSVSLASLLAKPAKKILPLIGVIAGGVILIFYLLANISMFFSN